MADINRSYFADQLADPLLRDRLFALTQAEVGGQGPDAQQAFLETVLNRAAARQLPLVDAMSRYVPSTGEGYYPSLGNTGALSDAQRAFYGNLLTRVMAGSDLTGGATGNASGTVGFAGGPMTARIDGEKFGIEGPDMRTPLPRFDTPGGLPMLAYDNPAPAMPNLPVLPPEIAQGSSGAPANRRVNDSFLALQNGPSLPEPPINVRPNSGALPQRSAVQDQPQSTATPSAYTPPQQGGLPMRQGGIGDFLNNNWLTLLALGGGIANGGIGEGFTQAARIGTANNKLNTTDDIKEFQYAVSQGYKGTFQDWQTIKKSLSGEFAKQPLYGTDAQGNTVLLQVNNRGEAVASKLPPGISVSQKPQLVDLGTHEAVLDPTTRQVVGLIPKNVAGKAVETAKGEAQGTALTGLSKVETDAQRLIDRIDTLEHHRGLDERTGFLLGRLPALTPDAQDVNFRIQELQGGAFLAAYNQLRGTGAISETEGTKATQAIARLQTAQSTKDFRTALEDFKGVIKRGLENQRRMAQGKFTPEQKAPANNDPFGLR